MTCRPSLLLLLLSCACPASAQDGLAARSDLDLSWLRELPVLDGERFKPLDSLARESVRSVTGTERFQGADPLLVYLHWILRPEETQREKLVKLPAARIAKEVGYELSSSADARASYDDLAQNRAFRLAVADAMRRPEGARGTRDVELLRLHGRYALLGKIMGRRHGARGDALDPYLPVVPPRGGMVEGRVYRWLSPGRAEAGGWPQNGTTPVEHAWRDVKAAFIAADVPAFGEASRRLVGAIGALEYPEEFPGMRAMEREIRLNRVRPFFWAAVLFAVAAFLALLAVLRPRGGVLRWLPVAAAACGLGIQAWGLWERTSLSGRALIGNLYESLVFVAGVCAALGILFGLRFRRSWFVFGGSLLAAVALAVAHASPDVMSPKITTLRPVLINNFWIHIHVPTIMASYAALALAFVLGHVWLVRYLFQDPRRADMKELARFTYAVIPVGVVLLLAGMVLGGLWADASWGRFWGWDPKETWSFITWLVFMVIVHGRWAGWLRDLGTAVGTMVGGWALLWTYYGVNFFQSGFHSYSDAGAQAVIPPWLWIFSAVELALLAGVVGKRVSAGGGSDEAAAPRSGTDRDVGSAPAVSPARR